MANLFYSKEILHHWRTLKTCLFANLSVERNSKLENLKYSQRKVHIGKLKYIETMLLDMLLDGVTKQPVQEYHLLIRINMHSLCILSVFGVEMLK